jgi:IS1 family transposase
MNKLNLARRAAVVRCLIDGMSIRATARVTNTDKDTVTKILVEVGEFCAIYQDHAIQNLSRTVRVEADEIWSFVGAKEGNKTRADQGDLWTYTAMDADSKLMITWLVGDRTGESTRTFMADLASRLANRVQLSTDAFHSYPGAVEKAFGWNGVDYATITKHYKAEGPLRLGRHSPSVEVSHVEVVEVMGSPKRSKVSTSYIERTNLSLRMNNRRFTRMTNCFSRKAENHAHSVALHFMAHNFLRAHGTLTKAAKGYKTSPAMAAGLTSHVWTVEEMMQKMEPNYAIAA